MLGPNDQEDGMAVATDDKPVGTSLEDAAKKEEAAQPMIEGFRKAFTDSAGGNVPDGSMIRLNGGKLALEGEFDKGDFVDLVVRVRVAEVHFVDRIDKHNNVYQTDRVHVCKLSNVQRATAAGSKKK